MSSIMLRKDCLANSEEEGFSWHTMIQQDTGITLQEEEESITLHESSSTLQEKEASITAEGSLNGAGMLKDALEIVVASDRDYGKEYNNNMRSVMLLHQHPSIAFTLSKLLHTISSSSSISSLHRCPLCYPSPHFSSSARAQLHFITQHINTGLQTSTFIVAACCLPCGIPHVCTGDVASIADPATTVKRYNSITTLPLCGRFDGVARSLHLNNSSFYGQSAGLQACNQIGDNKENSYKCKLNLRSDNCVSEQSVRCNVNETSAECAIKEEFVISNVNEKYDGYDICLMESSGTDVLGCNFKEELTEPCLNNSMEIELDQCEDYPEGVEAMKLLEDTQKDYESYTHTDNNVSRRSNNNNVDKMHWHCPFCGSILFKLKELKRHLKYHVECQSSELHTSESIKKKRRWRGQRTSCNFNKGSSELKPHISVVINLDSVVSQLTLPSCLLCENKTYQRQKSLMLHFRKMHVQKAVCLPNFILLCCRLFCDEITHCHYHCPVCVFVTPRMKLIYAHVKEHIKFLNIKEHKNNEKLQEINLKTQLSLDKERLNGVVKDIYKDLLSIKSDSYDTVCNEVVCNSDCKQSKSCSAEIEGVFIKIKSELEDVPNDFICVDKVTPDGDDYIAVRCAVKEEAVEASHESTIHITAVASGLGDGSGDEPSQHTVEGHDRVHPSLKSNLVEAYAQLCLPACYLCFVGGGRGRGVVESGRGGNETQMGVDGYETCLGGGGGGYKTVIELEVHFYRAHVRHCVTSLPHCLALVCALDCDGVEDAHLHCPHCAAVHKDAQSLKTHYAEYLNGAVKHELGSGQCDAQLSYTKLEEDSKKNDIRLIETSSSPILKQLLILETDINFSYMCAGFPHEARPSLVCDAWALFGALRPPHCPLCDDGREHRTARVLQMHFQLSHLKRASSACAVTSLMCRLSCKGFTRGHYHCPFCLYVIHDRTKLHVHQHKNHQAVSARAAVDRARGRPVILRGNVFTTDLTSDVAACSGGGGSTEGLADKHGLKTCEGGFLQGKKKFMEPVEFRRAVSVVNNVEELRAKLKLPDCILCKKSHNFFTEKRLVTHFEKNHVKHALQRSSFNILICRLYGDKYQQRGHYHCPWCHYSSHDKNILGNHMNNHTRRNRAIKQKEDAACRARLKNPDDRQQYKLVLENGTTAESELVQCWEASFQHYLDTDFAGKIRRNSCVMSHRRRKQIIDYLLFGTSIEQSLVRYVRFKNYSVVSSPLLGLTNCLVEHVVVYDETSDAAAGGASGGGSTEQRERCDGEETVAVEAQFYRQYRRVLCIEEFFQALYHLHVPSGGGGRHLDMQDMSRLMKGRFVFLPRIVVPKFLELCPVCPSPVRPSLPSAAAAAAAAGNLDDDGGGDGSGGGSAHKTVAEASLSHLLNTAAFMAVLQVNLVDMSVHADGCYHYIVHAQDRHTRLHWLFPLRRLDMAEVATGLLRRVVAVAGMPTAIVSNSGVTFVRSLVMQLQRLWTAGSFSKLLAASTSAVVSGLLLPDQDSSDVIKELTSRIVAHQSSAATRSPDQCHANNNNDNQDNIIGNRSAFQRLKNHNKDHTNDDQTTSFNHQNNPCTNDNHCSSSSSDNNYNNNSSNNHHYASDNHSKNTSDKSSRSDYQTSVATHHDNHNGNDSNDVNKDNHDNHDNPRWTTWLSHVQYTLNSRLIHQQNNTPYEAAFHRMAGSHTHAHTRSSIHDHHNQDHHNQDHIHYNHHNHDHHNHDHHNDDHHNHDQYYINHDQIDTRPQK